jgi:hypothetical protein
MSAPVVGSPEATAEAIAKAEEAKAAEAAAEAGDEGEKKVTLTEAEHNALQARLRKAEQAERDRKAKSQKAAAEAEKAALEDKLKKAEEAGLGQDLRASETERDALKARLDKVLTDNAIRDAAADRNWNLSQQRAASKMLDISKLERDEEGTPTPESVKEVLDNLVEEYPDIYTVGDQTPSGDKPSGKKAVHTPSNPTDLAEKGGVKFEGYISPDEYLETPFLQRQTPEFRARLEKSRQYWPDTFNPKDLQQG